MNKITSSNQSSSMWLAFALAVLASISYLLIALKVLSTGGVEMAADGTVIIFVAAGGYLLGGALILARRKWLWAIGILVNALVILFFVKMYQSQPAVMFSPGGLATKIPQTLLEVTLVILLIKNWLGERRKQSS